MERTLAVAGALHHGRRRAARARQRRRLVLLLPPFAEPPRALPNAALPRLRRTRATRKERRWPPRWCSRCSRAWSGSWGRPTGHTTSGPSLGTAFSATGLPFGGMTRRRWCPPPSTGAPEAWWVISACDLPLLRPEAIAWLLESRTPGALAVLPVHPDHGIQPTLALYGPGIDPLLMNLDAPKCLGGKPGVLTPQIPERLAACWTNVNDPGALDALSPRAPQSG